VGHRHRQDSNTSAEHRISKVDYQARLTKTDQTWKSDVTGFESNPIRNSFLHRSKKFLRHVASAGFVFAPPQTTLTLCVCTRFALPLPAHRFIVVCLTLSKRLREALKGIFGAIYVNCPNFPA